METKDILIFIAGIFASFIVNFVTQYTSAPLAKKYSEWRTQQSQKHALKSIEKARSRISKIEEELHLLEYFVANPVAFNAFSYRTLQRLVLKVAFLIFVGVGTILFFDSSTIGGAGFFVVFVFVWATTVKEDREFGYPDIFKHVYQWPMYGKKQREQLAELQKVVDGENHD